jgi:preprotein translocase subunit SecA
MYGERELCKWVKNKFDVELDPEPISKLEEPMDASDIIMEQAEKAYLKRERTYPVDFAIQMTTAGVQQNAAHALKQFCEWVRARYNLHWEPNTLPSSDPNELRKILLEEAERWDDSRIEERATQALAHGSSPDALDAWFRQHANSFLSDSERERAKDDPKSVAEEKIRENLRFEFTQFERWILLQIVDQVWKDHLYAIDQLRESIGFRSFSQRDPRIEFKKEGAKLFEDMQKTIRDKVTDLIFKARLQPQIQRRPQPQQDPAQQQAPQQPAPAQPRRPIQPAQPATAAVAAAAAAAPAAQAGAAPAKRQPARAKQKIGRNEMVTIVNPTTGEKETLKYKKALDKLESGWRLEAGD